MTSHPNRFDGTLLAHLRDRTHRSWTSARKFCLRLTRAGRQERLGPDVFAALRDAGAEARLHGERVGEAFLATGRRLQEQVRLTAALAQASGRFRAIAEPDEGANPARQAVGSIERTLRRLDQAEQESAILVARLQEQHAAIANLRSAGYQLERAFAPLKIIDTLFRIEAATLPLEVQAAFAALTEEIAHLDHRVRDTFARNFDALSLTRDAIGEVVARLAAQRSSIREMARVQREEMTQSLAAVQHDIEALRQRDQRARALVDRVDHDANAMVMSLQYQDITKQKLEHVLEAIVDLERRAADADGLSARRYVRHSCALQARQLEAIDTDLQQALATLDSGLNGVLQSLDALNEETSSSGRGDTLAGQVSGTLERLNSLLAALRAPTEGVSENARQVAGALQSFGGVTADLGATISDLTWGIRLIALNAQVQAAQVARCDGLEVLARNTYAVSEETSLLAGQIGSDLVALADRLRALVVDANAFEARTRGESADLATAVGSLTVQLNGQRDEVTRALDDFGATLVAARASGRDLVSNSDLARLDPEPLNRLRDRFQAIADTCATDARDTPAEPVLELQELRQNYTMESERAVHAAVLKDLRAPAAASGIGVGPSGLVPQTTRAERPEQARPCSGAAVAPAPANNVMTAPAADLGDNVELF